MATLNVIHNIEITTDDNGVTFSAKQGSAADAATEPFEVTVSGYVHQISGVLATATARTVWDEDEDEPDNIAYVFFWADVDMYIQFIGQTTNVVFPVEAKVPFCLSANTLLAAANTTAISGSAPSVEAIDSIVIQNNSGGNGNYVFAVIE
jgi:hypothetical protein